MIIDYNERIKIIDKFLSFFSCSNSTKWFILISLHYTIFPLLYIILLTTTDKHIFILSFIVVIIQIFLNYVDRGCILMKLERKYIGKDWYGPYGIIPNISKNNIQNIFSLAMIFLIISAGYRGYILFK
jgi:hypothetical protein